MKKLYLLFLAFATFCFIGLYGCKSTLKEEQAAEEVEVVEEVEAVEEVEEVDITEAAEEAVDEAVEEVVVEEAFEEETEGSGANALSITIDDDSTETTDTL